MNTKNKIRQLRIQIQQAKLLNALLTNAQQSPHRPSGMVGFGNFK
jgi:hypothetical protein